MGPRCASWLPVLFTLMACSTSTRRSDLDAGRDARVNDAAVDAARDAETDAAMDAVVDATIDAGVDATAPADAAFDGNDDQAIRADRMYAFFECPIRLVRGPVTLRRNYHYDCTRSADCTERPNGVCFADVREGELYDSHCRYLGCVSDSDCAENEDCECGWAWSGFRRCIEVECHDDNDCEPGQQCLSWPECYDDVRGKSCTTADDLCRTNQDCRDMDAGDICVDTGPRRNCAPGSCPE